MEQGDRRLKSNDNNSRAAGYRSRPVSSVKPRFRTNVQSKPTTGVLNDFAAPKAKHTLPAVVKSQSLATPNTQHTHVHTVHNKVFTTESHAKTINLQPNHHTTNTKAVLIRSDAIAAPRHKPQNRHINSATEPVIKDYSVNKTTHYKQSADADLANNKNVQTLPVPHKSRVVRLTRKIKHAPAKQKSGYGLIALAATLFILGVAVNLNSLFVTKKIEAQNVQTDGVIGDDTNGRPGNNVGYSETKPTETTMRQYAVAPDLPKYVNVESLGVWSRVIRVGVDASNQIGTPKNVYDTAWYEGSSKPGQPGAAFINGHVLGPTKGGIFAGLSKIKVGAKVSVTMGDNTIYNYRVVSTEKIDADKVDMNKVLRPYEPTKQGLNLMTCNGTYIKDKETFDKRFIVYTVREN